jgi:hypothetical protein
MPVHLATASKAGSAVQLTDLFAPSLWAVAAGGLLLLAVLLCAVVDVDVTHALTHPATQLGPGSSTHQNNTPLSTAQHSVKQKVSVLQLKQALPQLHATSVDPGSRALQGSCCWRHYT